MKPLSKRRLDLLCVGEALVDLLPERRGMRMREVERWVRCPGGSPANVAIGAARLGAASAYLGVVGEDEFGAFLEEALRAETVDVGWVRRTPEARTGIVFITLDADGERSFTDYRDPSAELLLEPRDIARAELDEVRIVHFVVNSLVRPQAAEAVRDLVARARSAGCVISCDPNPRQCFWDDPRRLQALLGELLPQVDVVKLASDEIEFCTGERDPERAVRALQDLGVGLAVVTLGERGAIACRGGRLLRAETLPVEVVDLTGAGDGFDAGMLSRIALRLREGKPFESLSDLELQDALDFGCRVGAAVVTRLGAVAGLPHSGELRGRG